MERLLNAIALRGGTVKMWPQLTVPSTSTGTTFGSFGLIGWHVEVAIGVARSEHFAATAEAALNGAALMHGIAIDAEVAPATD